jgi:hypothetical protein
MPQGPTTAQCRIIDRAMRGGRQHRKARQGAAGPAHLSSLRRGWIAEATLPGFGLVYRATSAGIAAVAMASTLL